MSFRNHAAYTPAGVRGGDFSPKPDLFSAKIPCYAAEIRLRSRNGIAAGISRGLWSFLFLTECSD